MTRPLDFFRTPCAHAARAVGQGTTVHVRPARRTPWRVALSIAAWFAMSVVGVSHIGVSASQAAARGPQITSVHVGFAGQYKLGYWTPVEVTVRAGDEPLLAELALTVPDGDGVLSRVYDEKGPLWLVVGEEQTRTVFVKFGQSKDELRVELRTDAELRANTKRLQEQGAYKSQSDGHAPPRSEPEVLAERTLNQGSGELSAPLAAGQELLVMVSPAEARSDARASAIAKDWQATVARLAGVAPLPTRWYGYDGVDLVVLSTSESEIYSSPFQERLEALTRWVQLGGRLLLAVGSNAAEVLGPEAPLVRFAPGKYSEMIPLRQTGVLEIFAGTSERLDSVAAGGAFRLDVPKLADVRGRIEAYEGNHPRDLPLVVRSSFGLGEVIFVGLDLDRPPFVSWRGRGNFIGRLLDRRDAADEQSDRRVLGHVTELGYTDLIGQLHLALSQFSGVQLVPFAVVAALVAIYILCIGPLDYFFLKRIVGRMQWTWVTFPALVLAFSGGIFALAHWLKGDKLHINQVDLVDVDADSGVVRGTSWSTIYSPRIDTFELSLRVDAGALELKQPAEDLLSWMAVPGSGLSGVGRAAGSAMFTQPYDFSPRLNGLEHLPIAMWSTRSLQARWWAESPSPMETHLTDRGDHLLGGTLRLPSDWPLADAVLIYDRWAYPLASEMAGMTIDVDKQLEPQTVETFYRHVTIFDEKSARAPYDRASTDLVRILQTMMFHNLIGGELYTNLANRAQGYIDLSNQVQLGRAVLVARASKPAATLCRWRSGVTWSDNLPQSDCGSFDLLDSEGQHLTFYRFVLPVASASGN